MANVLQSFSEQMIAAVEAEMRNVLHLHDKAGEPFFNMMHYHMGWSNSDGSPLERTAGKRVRPLLCLLTAEAAGGRWAQCVPGAAAIEIVHNFTLVHDDIQDASPTRRGRPTVWKLWGANQAINSGDAMFAFAHLAMARLSDNAVPPDIIVRAMARLDQTCVDLTVGQFADMAFESQVEVTVEEYIDMISGKTAALLSYCTELGATIAGSGPDRIDHYASFGRDLGLAFQVRDDILGIWGKESVIGKSAATDIATRKKSLPVLYGLAQSPDLKQLYQEDNSDEAFVRDVVALLEQAGAREFAEEREQVYADSALHHLEAAEPKGDAAIALRQLSDTLLKRNA